MYNIHVHLFNQSNEEIDKFSFRDDLTDYRQNIWFKVSENICERSNQSFNHHFTDKNNTISIISGETFIQKLWSRFKKNKIHSWRSR